MADKKISRELSIYINDREVINSLGGVNREIAKVNGEMRNLNKNSASYDDDLKRLKGTLVDLKDRQSEFKEEIQSTTEVSNEAGESFSKILVGLSSGNLSLAKEGFEQIRGSIVGMTKAAFAFIATPIGATIAVLSGIAIASKAIFDFNKGIQETNGFLSALGVNSKEISKVRSEIQATADTFEKEFSDIAEKANSISKSFGISISEANKIIAEGLATGGAQNKEFLDSLGEYDEFFSKAGFSAEEFANIINKGFELGIYTDKLPDALKEADLSLKEQTKSTRDALENAFGASFTDTILAKVAGGSITTKQALEEIAKQSEKTSLSQQQQAQLTADVFKGAGEDAGGALKILQAISSSATKELSETAKASLALVDANERLNKAQASLFEIEGFGSIWDVIKAKSIDALSSTLEWIMDVKKDIQPLIEFVGVVFALAWDGLRGSVGLFFDFFSGALKIFSSAISTTFDFVKKILTGDFLGAFSTLNKGFTNLANIVSNAFGQIKNTIIGTLSGILENIAPFLDAIGIDVDKIQKKLESFKSKEVVLKTSTKTEGDKSGEAEVTKATQEELNKQTEIRKQARAKEAVERQKGIDKKKADDEKAAKDELDKIMALAKAKSNLAKAELDLFILNNKTKLDNTQQLTPELIAEETKRLDEIKKKQNDALLVERQNKIADATKNSKSKAEEDTLKLLADTEYEIATQNLSLSFQQTTTGLKKQYEDQQKQLELEQLALDNELQLAEATTTAEADVIKQEQDYQAELSRYKKLFEDKKITEEEYNRFKGSAKEKQDLLDRQREIQQVQSTLGGLSALGDAVGQMFGQSKELALTMAAINGAQAITSILAQYPKFDGGFAMTAALIAAGITTAAQIKEITKAKAPKKPKFFYGGFTGSNPAFGTDEYGAVTGVVHSDEWVAPKSMTTNPKYAATLSWLEAERKGGSKKFFAGGETSPGTVATFSPGQTTDQSEMFSVMKAVLNRLENPIAPTLAIGYQQAEDIENLNTERTQSKNNATLNE